MLQYTTTNFVNTAGTWSAEAGKKFRLNFGPEFRIDDDHKITSIYVNKASKAELASATVDVSGLDSTKRYRIAVYIRISNNNASTYATNFTFKGKPLYLGEFMGGATGEEVAALCKKFCLAQYGEDLISVSGSSTSVTITAKNQFQKFLTQDNGYGVQLQVLDKDNTAYADASALTQPYMYQPVDGKVTAVCIGKEAFGDYTHMLKDLRLPTDENRHWYGIAVGDIIGGEPNDDQPLQGTYYTQITVTYEAERGLGQGDVMGGLAKSRTTHVFFVADSTPADGMATSETTTPAAGVAASFLTDLKSVSTVTPTYVEVPSSK